MVYILFLFLYKGTEKKKKKKPTPTPTPTPTPKYTKPFSLFTKQKRPQPPKPPPNPSKSTHKLQVNRVLCLVDEGVPEVCEEPFQAVALVLAWGNLYAGEDLADVATEVAVVEHGDVEAFWPEHGEEICQSTGALGELEPVHALVEGRWWGWGRPCTAAPADKVPRMGLCELVLRDVGSVHVLLCEGGKDTGDFQGAVGDGDGHENMGSVGIGVPVGELGDGPGKDGLDHGVEDPRLLWDIDAQKHFVAFTEPRPFRDEPQPVKVHICAREDGAVGWICDGGGTISCYFVLPRCYRRWG